MIIFKLVAGLAVLAAAIVWARIVEMRRAPSEHSPDDINRLYAVIAALAAAALAAAAVSRGA